jgi:anti-sigma B factor antagonist
MTFEPPPISERGATVVHFTGRKVSLDEETVQRIYDQLLGLADEPTESHLFLDFQNVGYLTSTALDALVSLHKRLLSKGRRMTVGNLDPQVYEVFAVTRLDELLDLRLARQGMQRLYEPASDPDSPQRRDNWWATPS